jgi:hypothetical protein
MSCTTSKPFRGVVQKEPALDTKKEMSESSVLFEGSLVFGQIIHGSAYVVQGDMVVCKLLLMHATVLNTLHTKFRVSSQLISLISEVAFKVNSFIA